MGRDKALLPWASGVLVDDVAAKLKCVTDTVTLIGDPARYRSLRYPCVPDLRSGLGPLAGIEAALSSGRAELNFILACDMPFIDTAHLRRLLEHIRNSDVDCVAASDALGVIHPLCAVYRSRCLPAIRAALDQRRLRLLDLIEELQTETVPFGEPIYNLNTVEDLEAALVANGH